jgi:hypothetical protein
MNTLPSPSRPGADLNTGNHYRGDDAKAKLPVAISSAGPIVPPKVFFRTAGSGPPSVVYTQSLFSRQEAWAIVKTNGSTCNAQPVLSGKLSLSCDEETWRFVDKNKLVKHMMAYIMMAAKCFNLIASPSCRLVHDPENDDQYLLADMHIDGNIEEILDSEDRFRHLIINSIPADDLYLIRLSYNIK